MQAETIIQSKQLTKLKQSQKPAVQPNLIILPESHERLWTREEYYKMAELGFFEHQRVELIEGRILIMSAMNSHHSTAITLAENAIRKLFAKGFLIKIQCPLSVNDISDPEPDVYVTTGSVFDFVESHPTTAALVVEIADSSLNYDQTEKASLYAKAKVPDYWIVNLKDRRLEVRRRPMRDKTMPYGFGYAELVLYTEKDSVSPLAKPKTKIAVKNLLPRKL